MADRVPNRPHSPAYSEAPPSYHAREDTHSIRSVSPAPTTHATPSVPPTVLLPLAGIEAAPASASPAVQFGLRYSFSQLTTNSMQLVPPPQAPDSRSLYHISVHMNLFKPQSFITVLRRGSSESGPYAGEFEHGPYERINRVVVGSTAKPLNEVIMLKARHLHRVEQKWNTLKWTFNNVVFHWEPDTSLGTRIVLHYKCLLRDKQGRTVLAHLATYQPSNYLTAREGIPAMPSLVVEQPGVDLIDHIVLSLLVLQRQDYPLPPVSGT